MLRWWKYVTQESHNIYWVYQFKYQTRRKEVDSWPVEATTNHLAYRNV